MRKEVLKLRMARNASLVYQRKRQPEVKQWCADPAKHCRDRTGLVRMQHLEKICACSKQDLIAFPYPRKGKILTS